MRPNRLLFGVALSLPWSGMALAHAVARDTAVPVTSSSPVTHPFSWYTQKTSPLLLKGRSAAKTIRFTVGNRNDVKSMHVHILGVNSVAMVKGASELMVELNGHLLEQIPLGGHTTKIDDTVTLPPGELRNGLNRLTLSAIQTTGKNCAGSADTETWTRISSNSTVTTDYEMPTSNTSLTHLRSMILTAENKSTPVLVLYSKSQEHTPEPIMAIARSVGKLQEPVPISVVARPLDNFEKAVTQGYPGLAILLERQKVRQQTHNENEVRFSVERNAVGGLVLMIAGNSPSALASAARMIGSKGIVWPDAATAKVVVTMPPVQKSDADGASNRYDDITFLDAGVPTQTEHGPRGQFAPLTFWNPNWGSHAILYLHLTYSAGAGPGSMVQAIVDGKMVNIIPLTSPTGGTYPDYKLLIPQNALKVGRNTLLLKPVFNVQTAAGGACTSGNFESDLGVTVFSDSHLSIIGGAPVHKSDLSAISAGVYYIDKIAVTHATPDMISAAATLGAKLAEVAPDHPVSLVRQRHPVAEDGMLVLGDAADMPRNLLMDAGIYLGGSSFGLEEPAAQEPSVPGSGPFQAATAWLRDLLENDAQGTDLKNVLPSHSSKSARAIVRGFGNTAVMAIADAQDRPVAPGSLAPPTVMVAQNDELLNRAVDTLIAVPVWRHLAGQAAVITSGDPSLQIMPATHIPASAPARLGFLATRNPLETLVAVLGALGLLILLIRGFVSLRRRRFHPNVKGVDE